MDKLKKGIWARDCPVCKSSCVMRSLTNDSPELACAKCGFKIEGNSYEDLVKKWNKLGTLRIKSKSQAMRLSQQV